MFHKKLLWVGFLFLATYPAFIYAQGCDPAMRRMFNDRCPTAEDLASLNNGVMRPVASLNPDWDNDRCTSYDLRDQGNALRSMPITDQNPLGVCYAHAATAMIDSWRFNHSDIRTHHTSEIAAAIMLREHSLINPFQQGTFHEVNGGNVCHIVDLVRERGSCNADRITSGPKRRGWSLLVAQVGDMVANYHRTLHVQRSPLIQSNSSLLTAPLEVLAVYQTSDVLAATTLNVAHCINHHLGASILNTHDTAQMAILSAAIYRQRTNDIYAMIINQMCTGNNMRPVTPAIPACQTETVTDALAGYRELSRWLGPPNVDPPAINFCAGIFNRGPEARFITRPGIGMPDPDACGAHAVTIIARRRHPTTQRCQLLLRNSWGRSCNWYSAPWNNDCEGGNVWMDAEVVMQNTFSFNYLHDE